MICLPLTSVPYTVSEFVILFVCFRYEEQLKERESQLQKEDLSDMVAEHAAKQKVGVSITKSVGSTRLSVALPILYTQFDQIYERTPR